MQRDILDKLIQWKNKPNYPRGKASRQNLGDVGLLATQSYLDATTLLEGSRIFTEFKGALDVY